MKIALCLYGRVGNKATKTCNTNYCSDEILEIGHSYYNKYLFNNYDVDTYIHSWSFDLKDKIVNTYNPKSYEIEPQEHFTIPNYVKANHIRGQAHWSRWKSTYKVTQLLNTSDSNYDLVILSRFDLTWKINPVDLSKDKFYVQNWCCYGHNNQDIYHVGVFNKITRSDVSKLPHFHKGLEHGMIDWFFISSKENIVKFGELYLNINEYSKTGNDINGVVSSHVMGLIHLEKVGLRDRVELKYCFDDCSLIRREIFNSFG